MRLVLLLFFLLLVACDTSNPPSSSTEKMPLNPLTEAKARMAFNCVHEQIPEAPAEADVLFRYAR
jgi:hypothetical protein